MAVTKTILGTARDTSNVDNVVVTLSRAIAANKPCLAFYIAHSTAPADASTCSGGGVTWTKRATSQRGNFRITVFSADGVASPSGTSITLTNVGATSPTANDAFIVELDGSDGTPSGWLYNANNAAASTTVTATLGSAPGAGDYGLAVAAFLATGGISWTASFTEDSDSTHANPACNSAMASDDGSPPTSVTATGTSANAVIGYVGIIVATSSESHSGTLVVTGGGVLTSAQSTNRNRSGSLVGGGIVSWAKATARNLAQLLTGGGVITPARTSNRNRAGALTGGGVEATAQTTNRNRSQLLTGGGVLVVSGSASSAEAHSGTLVVTGGGVLVVSARAGQQDRAILTGGGVINWAELTGRLASIQLTGGGALVIMGGQDVALTDLGAVMCAIGDALEAADVGGGRVFCYPPDSIEAPACVVGYPTTIEFDATMQRGADRVVIPVYYLTGRTSDRAAQQRIAGVITGAAGVKDALDGNLGGVVDTLRVQDMRVLRVDLAGVEYLSAVFSVEAFV